MGDYVFEVKELRKSFGDLKVLDGLDFSVKKGSIFGFVGLNGSGKTTTMKIALGLLESDGGEVTIAGEKAVYGRTAKAAGYLPDVPEYYTYMKPTEYLKLCGEISGMSAGKIKQRSDELLEIVGLANINRKIGGFSRGMKQRLGIAQALLNEPGLLICDEPTSALDPIGRKEILDILSAVKEQTTVVFSTHILADVERICDSVALLNEGKAVISGTLSELQRRVTDSYRIEFENEKDARNLADCFPGSKKDGNVVRIKKVEGTTIIRALAERGLAPQKYELMERSLEELFMEVVS